MYRKGENIKEQKEGGKSLSSSMSLDWRNVKPSVGEGMSHVFETGLYTDVSFKIGPTGFTLNAHKFILMMRSEVFAVQFSQRWTPPKDNPEQEREIVHLPDRNPESFKRFLKYLYTDEFTGPVAVQEALDVLDLSHFFQVPGLLSKCSECLKSKIGVNSCVEIYQRTRLYSEMDLSALVFEFMNKNISLVASSDQFLHLNVNELTNVLNSDDLVIDELLLFKALLRWGDATDSVVDQCGQSKPRKDVMKSLIPLIRFLLMKPTDFAEEVVPTNVLSKEEIVEVFCYLNRATKDISKNERLATWAKRRQPKEPENDELKCFPIDVTCNTYYCIRFNTQRLIPQFRFRCSSPVTLRGLKIYGLSRHHLSREPYFRFKIQFNITNANAPSTQLVLQGRNLVNGMNIWETDQEMTRTDEEDFDVLLGTPFQTEPNKVYWISAVLIGQGVNAYGESSIIFKTHGVRQQKDDIFIPLKSKSGNVTIEISHNSLCTPVHKNCLGRNNQNSTYPSAVSRIGNTGFRNTMKVQWKRQSNQPQKILQI